MSNNIIHVPGQKRGAVMLYALSTCGWCAKTKKLLDDLGIDYNYLYIDHLQEEEKEKAVEEVTKWNPSCSFPTLVINEDQCIVGYKEAEIREELGL